MNTPAVQVYRAVVPEWLCSKAVRLMHVQLRSWGLDVNNYNTWQQNAWPWIQAHETMRTIGMLVGRAFEETEDPAVQIIWHLPDPNTDAKVTMHIDVPDEGKVFTRIVGVALTDWTELNGAPRYHDERDHKQVLLSRGDVFNMDPGTYHTAGFNLDAMPRCGLYLRWQRPADNTGGNGDRDNDQAGR